MGNIDLEGQIIAREASIYGGPILDMFPHSDRTGTIFDISFALKSADEQKDIFDPEFSGDALLVCHLNWGSFNNSWFRDRRAYEYLGKVYLRSKREIVPSEEHENRYRA